MTKHLENTTTSKGKGTSSFLLSVCLPRSPVQKRPHVHQHGGHMAFHTFHPPQLVHFPYTWRAVSWFIFFLKASQNSPLAFFRFTCFHPGKLSYSSLVISNAFCGETRGRHAEDQWWQKLVVGSLTVTVVMLKELKAFFFIYISLSRKIIFWDILMNYFINFNLCLQWRAPCSVLSPRQNKPCLHTVSQSASLLRVG